MGETSPIRRHGPARPSILDTLTGMTEEGATALASQNGYVVHVASREGKHYMRTADVRMNRINLSIVNGLVTKATIG